MSFSGLREETGIKVNGKPIFCGYTFYLFEKTSWYAMTLTYVVHIVFLQCMDHHLADKLFISFLVVVQEHLHKLYSVQEVVAVSVVHLRLVGARGRV